MIHADTLDEREHRQGGDLRGLRPFGDAPPLDLSTCVNLHGPHPAALRALAEIDPGRLRAHPYGAVQDFLDAYSPFLGVPTHELLPLRGITEGLRAVHSIDPRAVVVCPDYTESIGLFEQIPGSGRDTVDVRAGRVLTAMATHRHGTVVLSNPNNPLGLHIPSQRLAEIADRYPDCLLVVDEAYADFLTDCDSLLGVELDNVAVLRAPNKLMGMAGARTGALWTRNPTLRRAVADRLLTWPMSLLDSVAAVAALRQPVWAHDTLREILTVAGWMGQTLEAMFGVDVLPSRLHFRFLLRKRAQLDALWTHLDLHNIAVRVFPHATPGRVPGMRIVAPTLADWPRLEAALADFPA